MAALEVEEEEEEGGAFEEGLAAEESRRELLTVRTVWEEALLEEGRTGSSSSMSWGVRETAEEVGTSPKMSVKTCEDCFSSARR